jgi:putative ABC transport system permease protein
MVGVALAFALVRLAQPSGDLDAVAKQSAALDATVAVSAGLLLFATAAALAFLHSYDSGRTRLDWVGRLPWELAAIGAGIYLLVDVAHGGGVIGRDSPGGPHPSLAVFLLPLLLLAGASGLTLRGLRRSLRLAGRREGALPLPLYLALRRLIAARGLLMLLTILCSLSLGLLFYAQTLASSLDRTAHAKAYVSNGSDVQATIDAGQRIPRTFPFPATTVEIVYQTATVDGISGTPVDVIAVDPASLAPAVHWEPSWGQPPERWAAALNQPGVRLPAVVARPLARATSLWISSVRIPISVKATVAAFPGMTTQSPFVVVSLSTLARAGLGPDPLTGGFSLVWARGPTSAVEAALLRSTLRPYLLLSADDVLAHPDVTLATRTFSFLRAAGTAIGVFALLGVILYLYARQRAQTIASAFAYRMGVSRRTIVLSLWLELATILCFATTAAAAIAVAAAGPVVRHTDPLPEYPPGPLVAIPWTVIAASLPALAAFALIAATIAERLARRRKVAEELRLV